MDTVNTIFKRVKAIVCEIIGEEIDIKMDSSLMFDIGLVSIGFVELIVEVEEAYGINFPDNFLIESDDLTIREIVNYVDHSINYIERK